MSCRKNGRGGFSRAAALWIIAGSAAAVLLLLPAFRAYRTDAQTVACASALDTARRQLAEEFLTEGDLTLEQAENRLDHAMNGWRDLCPAGGSVYLTDDEANGTGWSLICGLHESDRALRTRVNASYAKERLEESLAAGTKTVTLNGQEFTAEETDEVFYTMSLPENSSHRLNYSILYTAADGEITRFGFADDSCYAVWDIHDGWFGSAYADD